MMKQDSLSVSPQDVILSIGFAQFKKETPIQLIQQIVDTDKQTIICNEKWQIGKGKYFKNHWNQLLLMISKAHCKQILINRQHLVTIPLQLHTPLFTNLSKLGLYNNQIKSIEPLQFIQSDSLRTIWLQLNQISIFNALKKTKWSQLQIIVISQNYINQIDFSRIKTNLFETCDVLWLGNFYYKNKEQNIAKLAKFETNGKSPKQIQDRSNQLGMTIRQHQVLLALKRKFN